MGSRHPTSVVRLERQAPLLPEPSCWPSRREKSLVETHEVGGYSKMGEVCRSQVLRHSYHLSWWKLGVLHCTRVYLTVIRTLAHTRAHTNTLVGFKWLFGELRYLKIVWLLPVTFHLFTIMGILISQPGRVFKTYSVFSTLPFHTGDSSSHTKRKRLIPSEKRPSSWKGASHSSDNLTVCNPRPLLQPVHETVTLLRKWVQPGSLYLLTLVKLKKKKKNHFLLLVCFLVSSRMWWTYEWKYPRE